MSDERGDVISLGTNLRPAMTAPEEEILRKDFYKQAGVDTEEADLGVASLIAQTRATWPRPAAFGGVMIDTDFFANVINIGDGIGIALCTDGVGSKTIIASAMQKYDTIGIDCVAMNVNDMICVGAEPISMVDYIAVDRADKAMLNAIGSGLNAGAKEAGISISGGETAQLADVINGFDLVGMAIGRVELNKVLRGQDVSEGDIVIGVRSSGVHSNGLSLARKAFLNQSPAQNRKVLHSSPSDLGRPLGEELLEPTHIYVQDAREVLETVAGVKALVNVTSDGLLNLCRVAASVSFEIDHLIDPHPIFRLIQSHSGVDDSEMFEVFNMGIGFCYIVTAEAADQTIQILKARGRMARRIGYAVSGAEKTVRLLERGLIGQGKKFWADQDASRRYG